MNYQEFAANAIDAVYNAPVTNEVASTATMYAGSLFVTCDSTEAAAIKTALIEKLKCRVAISKSKIGNEYAFDFIEG